MVESLRHEDKQVLKCVTQWKWSRIHEDVTKLLTFKSSSSSDAVNFCRGFLITSGKSFSNGFDINVVQIAGLQQLIKAARECHDLLLTERCYVNSGNLQVLKALYYILYKVLPLDHYLGQDIANQLTKELKCYSSVVDVPKDVTAILQNAYLLLWNRAQMLDQDKELANKHIHSLNLRLNALQFLYMASTDYVRFCEQVTKAARNYQTLIKTDHCPHLENFYKKLFSLFLEIKVDKSEHISSTVVPKLLSASLNVRILWINYLLDRFLTSQAEKSIMEFKSSVFSYYAQYLPKNSTLPAIAHFSCDILLISTHLCNLVSESKSALTMDMKTLFKQCQPIDKMSEEFRAVWESCCSLLYNQLCNILKKIKVNPNLSASASLHLMDLNSVLGHIVALRISNSTEITDAMSCTFTAGNLSYYCSFYQVLLSISAIALSNFDKTNSQFSDAINAALTIASQFSQMVKNCHHSYGSHYVSCVWPIGSKCYSEEFFSEALGFFKPCCKFIKMSVKAGNSENAMNLNKTYIKFTTLCFCKVKDYFGALNFLAEILSTNYKYSKKLLELWVKVKEEAKSFIPSNNLTSTTVKLVLKIAPKFKRTDLVSLLMQEFEAYKIYDAQDEKHAVMKDLLEEEKSMDDFSKAVVLIDYAELQLITYIDPKRSPRTCCNKAIQLLDNWDLRPDKKAFPSEKDCQLAHAFFVLHLLETSENQAASEVEVINQNTANVAAVNRKSAESCSSCNIAPAYFHITMELEFNSLFYLDKSLDMWSAIVATKPKNIDKPLTAINDLKSMAEFYSLVRMVSREVQAWKLVLNIAKAVSNTLEWGKAVARLVSVLSRNGLTHEASIVLQEFKPLIPELEFNSESQSNNKNSQLVRMYLLLAESELSLMKGKVCEGWEYLQTVRNYLASRKASLVSTIVQCEVNLLLSKFLELPSSVLNFTSDIEDSPIVFAIRSLTSCLDLVKAIINRKDFKLIRAGMDLKPRLINLLMECALRVGYLFQDIGAPRESSCFLKEQLLWAQKMSLANRSAELLLALGKLDIITGHYQDCQSKLHGVQFIIESPGKQLQMKSDTFPDLQDGDILLDIIPDDCSNLKFSGFSKKYLAQQSEDSKTCSPDMKNKTIFLNWQQHSSSCLCTKCKQVVFHRLRLELAFAQTECHFYANNNHVADKAMKSISKSISTILSYAETWRKIEHSLLLEMTYSNVKLHTKSNNGASERPLLQLDVITCNALCKLTQMRIQEKDFHGAYFAIKRAYSKISSVHHIGVAQTHFLHANTIYFYCLVKLHLCAEKKGLSLSQFLNQKFWSRSERATSKSTKAVDVDFLIANVDNICITATNELADCFKTPRNVTTTVAKWNDSYIKDAPMKKITTLSAFDNQFSESESQVLTPVKLPKSKKNLPKIKNTKPAAILEVKCDEKLDSTIDLASPERGVISKSSGASKLFAIGNQENSDAEIRSPVKKTPNARSVLGSFSNVNIVNSGQMDKPVLNLGSTSSPEKAGSPFISAKKIRKAPKASRTRNKLGSTSSNTSIPAETVRRSLRCRSRECSDTVSTSSNNAEIVRCNDLDDSPVFTPGMLAPVLFDDSTFQNINSFSRTIGSDKIATEAVHLLINELETLRGSSPNTPSLRKTSISKAKVPGKKTTTMSRDNSTAFTIDKIILLLEKAISLTCHHPHMPLYADLNLLLIMCKGENDDSIACNLFESMALTLRHQANHILTAKISKLTSENVESSINPTADISKIKERRAIIAFSRNIIDWQKSVESISNKISEGWTVCQVNVVPSSVQSESYYKNRNPELIITRLQRNYKPLIAKTSFKESLDGVNNFNGEFDSIVQESTSWARLTDRNLWWSKRQDVDNRLKALVKSMEDYWLGHWKGLLLGNPAHEDDRRRLEETTSYLVKKIRSKGFEKFDERLLEAIVNSFSFLGDLLPGQALAELLCTSYDDKRIEELCMIFKKKCACLCSNIIQRQHVILILDKELQKFPWENMPILISAPISRMPSIHFLLGHIALYGDDNLSTMPMVTVDTSNAYFVLNPGNDLPSTEKQLSVTFETLNWGGVTRRPPTSEEWSKALSQSDLFLYNGHGSGNQYVSLNCIQKSECRACVLLIGCSSGKLKPQGRRLEFDGVALHYLLAGCPSVMGNLWDVTDKAIDKFLEDLLKYWLPGDGQRDQSLCQAVVSARANCSLLFAIGAAPVMYGLPIQAKER